MARQSIRATKKKPEAPQYRCRDCAHSYDWHNKTSYGHIIFCRCPYDAKSQFGKFCKFLSDYQCDHFVKRKTEDHAEAD